MIPFNYHHLYYFFVIAKEGGVARAAEKLKLGQPTLSTQLKIFEDALGFQLFERKGRKLVLTDSGKIAYEYAQKIFTMGQEFLEVINDKRGPELVHLQIGALDSVPKDIVFHLTNEIYKNPKCFVSVLEGPSDMLTRELLAHRIDLALMNNAISSTPTTRFVSRKVGSLPVSIFGAPKFLDLKKGFPKSLEGEPLVANTQHSKLRQDVDHYFESRDIKVHLIGETQDTAVQKLILLSGRALAVLPRFVVQKELNEKKLVEIGMLEGIQEEFWINTAGRIVKNPVLTKLLNEFRI